MLAGRAGNDHIIGGAGADTINGGDGSDDIYYEGSGVTINLSTGTAKGGDATGDVLIDVENIMRVPMTTSSPGTVKKKPSPATAATIFSRASAVQTFWPAVTAVTRFTAAAVTTSLKAVSAPIRSTGEAVMTSRIIGFRPAACTSTSRPARAAAAMRQEMFSSASKD